ncbi:MAG: Translation initiation factor IF-3 [uncultured bacterium]|nr:MAG: Translation initiation factor IF-3 [uncultured bacterium]
MAQEDELDLVIISEKANPPVAKILDFNKFLYEERKRSSAIKAKSKKSELKEFIFGPTISDGDINVRVSRAKGFIEDGNRVRIAVKYMGREREHLDVGREKLNKFIELLADTAKVESEPKMSGNILAVTFVKK